MMICHRVLQWGLLLLVLQLSAAQYISADLSGNLRLILTASHGGTLKPGSITDRQDGCYNSTDSTCIFTHVCPSGTSQNSTHCGVKTTSDFKTDVIANLLRDEICQLKNGTCPMTVVSNVHRSKVDLNREINEATFGDELATEIYDMYHGNITAAINKLNGPGVLIDIHGHKQAQTWTMVGLRVWGSTLNVPGTAAMDLCTAGTSSIFKLFYANLPNDIADIPDTVNDIVRGNHSFGAYMEAQGLDAVPSPDNPRPETATYYSTGYTSTTYKDTIDAIQMEIHYDNRTPKTNRDAFVPKFAEAIVAFYNKYYN